MIYRIEPSKSEKGKYLITSREDTCMVDRKFIESRLNSGKIEWLDKNNWVTVRTEWDLSKLNQETKQECAKLLKSCFGEILPPDYTFYKEELERGEYKVCESKKYPKMYELWWKNSKYGYYNFVLYFFDLEAISTLIREHQMWKKFERLNDKTFRRDSYQSVLGSPKEDVDEE